MAQNISLMGASYPDVPSVKLPKTGGGQASFVDVTGASLSSSDGAKILTGNSAFGNDGKLITGTGLDYNEFATYMIDFNTAQVTLASDSHSFPIPACDFNGRPIRWISVHGNFGILSTTSTATQRSYVNAFTYSRDYLLKISVASEFMASTVRVGKSNSTTATAFAPIYGQSYFFFSNFDQVESGQATVSVNTEKASTLWFRGGVTYYVTVGG
jgi:hypothetical protein